jgi:hypothetical protein
LLLPGKIFKTPSLIYAVSNRGTGEASEISTHGQEKTESLMVQVTG